MCGWVWHVQHCDDFIQVGVLFKFVTQLTRENIFSGCGQLTVGVAHIILLMYVE